MKQFLQLVKQNRHSRSRTLKFKSNWEKKIRSLIFSCCSSWKPLRAEPAEIFWTEVFQASFQEGRVCKEEPSGDGCCELKTSFGSCRHFLPAESVVLRVRGEKTSPAESGHGVFRIRFKLMLNSRH